LEYQEDSQEALIEQRNFFQPGDLLERFSPTQNRQIFTISEIYDQDGNRLDAARHPLQVLKIKTATKLEPYDLLRKVI
jgi:putative protease